jgi:hypothetical protein
MFDYAIRVMRDGTEAEIVGGFKFGLTEDFVKILSASRQISVVHLDSIGGRLGEGEKMFKLIRDRGLNTYVSSKCLSACTLAFAGGRERFLHRDASLGFHKGTFPGVREGDFDSIQRNVFRSAGFDETFIVEALSTPHNEMWRPSPQALMRAKVVTGIADGSKFAFSGLGADLPRSGSARFWRRPAGVRYDPNPVSRSVCRARRGILQQPREGEDGGRDHRGAARQADAVHQDVAAGG